MTSELLTQAIEITNKYGEISISLLHRMFLKDYSLIIDYKQCAELIEEIKETYEEK